LGSQAGQFLDRGLFAKVEDGLITLTGTAGWRSDRAIDVADEIDASVIVIGSQGLKGICERFEGSVSHEVAEHAGRPVSIVPPENGR
jgi:nucleotide-binding universal stress UspA family protein